jgi:hypothetical protein
MSRHRIAQWLAATFVGFAASSASKADVIVDATAQNSTTALPGGASAIQVSPQSTGTGVFNPFLRLDSNSGVEAGLNSDAKKPPFDDIAGIHTKSIFFGQLVPVTISGTSYIQFRLDINQEGAKPADAKAKISLTDFRIYLGNTAFPVYDPTTKTFSSGPTTSVYDIDNFGNDVTVNLDSGYNPGSGIGDYYFNIPTSKFGASPDPLSFVYLYTQFGTLNPDATHFEANDGFEEWSTVLNPNVPPPITNPVPAPPALVLGLVGAAGLFGKRAWARKRTPEMA